VVAAALGTAQVEIFQSRGTEWSQAACFDLVYLVLVVTDFVVSSKELDSSFNSSYSELKVRGSVKAKDKSKAPQ